MRRRFEPTLFQQAPPKVYLFDTSAWLNIKWEKKEDDVWVIIRRLVAEARIFTCREVVSELKNDEIYKTRIAPIEDALLAGIPNSLDVEYLLKVGAITHQFSAMSKALGERAPADPYIVALALMDNTYIVVADENMRRKSRKIPGACEKLRIPCITLKKFIADEKN
jgi:hypothetical protein